MFSYEIKQKQQFAIKTLQLIVQNISLDHIANAKCNDK
jgi:hypothetical protein